MTSKSKVQLTRRKAIEICRDLWRWVAKTDSWDKSQWPGWKKVGYMNNDCPCCEYAVRQSKRNGSCIPILMAKSLYDPDIKIVECHKVCILKELWPMRCDQSGSPYSGWCNHSERCDGHKKKRAEYANIIADYCEWLLTYHRPCSEGYTRGCPNAKEGLCYCRKWIPGEHNGHCGRTSIDCQGMG